MAEIIAEMTWQKSFARLQIIFTREQIYFAGGQIYFAHQQNIFAGEQIQNTGEHSKNAAPFCTLIRASFRKKALRGDLSALNQPRAV